LEGAVSVDVVVMAHQRREALVYGHVLPRLGTDAKVVWDSGGGRWDTGRRCLLAGLSTMSRWLLVVQDDAILPRNFGAGVEWMLPYLEKLQSDDAAPVSFYVGAVQPFRQEIARRRRTWRDISFLRMPDLNWGVAVAYPTHLIRRIIIAGDRHSNQNYDARAGAYFTERNIPIWYTWPSLVDHGDGPSLVEGRTARRKALRFIGREADARAVRWGGAVVDIRATRPHHDAAARR
jgi:hypothetical protein